MNDIVALVAVPAQRVYGVFGARLFQHNADCICETNGIMRGVCGQEEQGILVDRNVDWGVRVGRGIHGLEEHRAFVLIEELGGGVDMVVSAGIGTTNDHDCQTTCGRGGRVIDAVVVDGRLEEMGIFLEPVQH